MQLIAADIGNSSTKVAVEHSGHADRWCLETIFRGDEPIEFDFQVLDITDEPAFWAVSSVNTTRLQRLTDWVSANRHHDKFHLIRPQDVNLQSDVESRDRLGRDRLIAAWQAVQLNEGGPLIVIDAGTAVTIDLVSQENVFLGGLIFPGAHTNLKFLANETDALPDLADEGIACLKLEYGPGFLGKSTESAILLGVYQAQMSAMKVAVQQLTKLVNTSSAVYLTGGGIQEILQWLPDEWQFVPDLVLRGAREIGRELLKLSSGKS